jgi:hypothetical protein
MASQTSLYAQWRARNEARLHLRERAESAPPERLLQSIWFHQRLRRCQLVTLDGQPVRVLHPGFWNRQAGPDFRGAVVQFGREAARSGDVEVDALPHHWRTHQHDRNPAFADVILHVVWNGAESGAGAVPALALEKFVDVPLEEIEVLAGRGPSEDWPEALRGACSAPMSELAAERANDLLQQAAQVRFQRKAGEFEARAREAGWEQALWEGLFRALGYRQNVWPMQRLAELLPILCPGADDALLLQARLLGVGGLLPSDIPEGRGSQNSYVRTLWDFWWRERENFSDVILPRNLWRFNGLRPANQPQRRLALAAHWLASKPFFGNLERWLTPNTHEPCSPASLLACLQAPADDFWSWHWGLRTARLAKPQPLLGATRATDLAINVILPWYWTRARSGKSEGLAQVAWERYLAWPAAQDNSALVLARRRLFAGRAPGWMKSAVAQQGLLQIVRDFCDHSNAICTDCPFPELVRNFDSLEQSREQSFIVVNKRLES